MTAQSFSAPSVFFAGGKGGYPLSSGIWTAGLRRKMEITDYLCAGGEKKYMKDIVLIRYIICIIYVRHLDIAALSEYSEFKIEEKNF